jgi:hypothetical protein
VDLSITTAVLKALMKNFEMNTFASTVAFWLTIHDARNQSTNLDVVLVARSRSPIDEVR